MTELFFILGYFLPFHPPNSPKSQNKKKKTLEMSSFYLCVPKIMIRWCMVPETWCTTDERIDGRTDGQKDGQEKSNTEVGAHLKISCNYGNYFTIDSIILYPSFI